MSSSLQKIAEDLANDALEVMDATGNERFFVEVAQMIGASSQTLEEAFLTEVRVRLAARKAKNFIATHKRALG